MSYSPTHPAAKAAVEALLTEPGMAWGAKSMNHEALREVLIAAYCPLPCVGVVNDTGWHRACEAAADSALAGLWGSA